VTGIEVVKVMYCILKFGGFPVIAILYGYSFKQYEYFFEQHIDTVLMLTVGSGYVLADSLHEFSHSITVESSIYAIMYGVVMVAIKSLLGVVFSAIGAWLVRIVAPYFSKRSEPLKKWIKNKFK